MQKSHLGILTGKNVLLRIATEKDARAIIECVRRYPEVPGNFSFFAGKVPSVEEERAYLRRMRKSPQDLVFVILDKQSGEFLGTCGLHDIDLHNDAARLGYILFNLDAHGKGIIQEAVGEVLLGWAFGVEWINLNRVYLNAFTTNIAAVTADLRMGFQIEGRLRQFYKIHGTYHDVYPMSMLREEWQRRSKEG